MICLKHGDFASFHLRMNDGFVFTDVQGYSSALLMCEWLDDLCFSTMKVMLFHQIIFRTTDDTQPQTSNMHN